MNTVAVVCLVLGCSLSTFATDTTREYGGNRQVCCSDYMGRRVRPGQSYYDGCNTCICGQNGMPSVCTLRYCGPNGINIGRPTYGANPVNPVLPAMPVNRIPPVLPINTKYNVNPTVAVAPPRYVPYQMRRY